MTEQQTPYPSEDQPVAASSAPATTETTEAPTPGKARRWLAGAMLVTVGLVAGSGTTYAFTSNPTSNVPGATASYGRGGFGGAPMGGPLGGFGQGEGTLPDQQLSQTDPGTTTPGTTTPGTSTEGTSTDSQPA